MGYIIFWIIEETMEIHKLAVKKEFKRMGIGTEMMNFLLDRAAQKNIEEIFLEVRESNLEAVRFYEKYDFKKTDCRKNYFNNPREDALVYVRYLKV